MVQVLVDHRRGICSLTVVLKLWLDHAALDVVRSFAGVREPAPSSKRWARS